MSGSSPVPGALSIACVIDNGTASLSLEGELDIATAPSLEMRLDELEAHGSTHLMVDLGGLAFIDSTGLRVLLQANARAQQRGHELTLRPARENVQQVFEITGAQDVLSFVAPHA
ncbi:MAG TPA: STAS domain-containing protein [Solirubrobacteraceae bacterium]|jgi:anti-sigma B factor antagonist/stage II sporulation protein AA (anti-sigma F factor antagonist)